MIELHNGCLTGSPVEVDGKALLPEVPGAEADTPVSHTTMQKKKTRKNSCIELFFFFRIHLQLVYT